MIKLRDWQILAFDEFKNQNYKGILSVATGKGKTIFAIHCINQLNSFKKNFRTAIIVPTVNLLKQWKDELVKFCAIDESEIGVFYGGQKDDYQNKRIMIFVVNSAVINDHLKEMNQESGFDFLIGDECHHYGADIFSKIFDSNFKYALGLSATPEREDDDIGNEKLIKGLGKKFFELKHLDDPIAIPKFVINNINLDLTHEEESEYEKNGLELMKLTTSLEELGLDSTDKEFFKKVKELADKRNGIALRYLKFVSKQATLKYNAQNKLQLVLELIKLHKNQKIIVFCERIQFVNDLFKLVEQEGLLVYQVHSGMSKNEVLNTLEQFKDSKESILIAPRIIDEGYDVPDASVAIIAAFTKSSRQIIQRDGRILRKNSDEKIAIRYALILKNVEEYKYFNLLHKSETNDLALKGSWLRWNDDVLEEDSHFMERFQNYKSDIIQRRNSFKDYISKKLDQYEEGLKSGNQNDIALIEERLAFFKRFKDVIDDLAENNPDKWFLIRKKLSSTTTNEIFHAQSPPNQEELKTQLRKVNCRIQLPDELFNFLMRCINGEKVETSPFLKTEIANLSGLDSEGWVWSGGLLNFIRQINNEIGEINV